jgi:exonuclease VII large subunit
MWWYLSALVVAYVVVLTLRGLSRRHTQAMMESLTRLAAASLQEEEHKQRQREQRMDEARQRLEAALSELGAVLEAQVARTERLAERQYLIGSGRWSTRNPMQQSIPPSPRIHWTPEDFLHARHPEAIDTTATECTDEGGHRRDNDPHGDRSDDVGAVHSRALRAGTDAGTTEERDGAVDGVGDHHTG